MSLRLLHPIMPHITEKVWQLIPQKTDTKAIMLAKFPISSENLVFSKEAKEMELVFETISSLRNVRQSFNIPLSLNFDIEIHASKDEEPIFKEIESYIKRMAKVGNITYSDSETQIKKSASAVVSASKIIIPLENLIDFNQEIARQNKKLEKLSGERKSLEGRINNPKFVSNAPADLIKQTRERIDEILLQEESIKDLIKSLS